MSPTRIYGDKQALLLWVLPDRIDSPLRLRSFRRQKMETQSTTISPLERTVRFVRP